MSHDSDEKLFKKEYVNIVKGIAIVLMFFHHFYNLSWIDGYSIFDIALTDSIHLSGIVSDCGKICISLFAIVTGYGIYVKCSSWKNSGVRSFLSDVLKKILSVFMSYWGLLLVFCIPIYLLCGNPFPTLWEVAAGG